MEECEDFAGRKSSHIVSFLLCESVNVKCPLHAVKGIVVLFEDKY